MSVVGSAETTCWQDSGGARNRGNQSPTFFLHTSLLKTGKHPFCQRSKRFFSQVAIEALFFSIFRLFSENVESKILLKIENCLFLIPKSRNRCNNKYIGIDTKSVL